MKIIITNNDKNIGVIKDFNGMDNGLIGQVIVELEIIKTELLGMYQDE